MTPADNESLKKKKSVRINKAGQYLKPLLVQCALASIKKQKQLTVEKAPEFLKNLGYEITLTTSENAKQ